MNATLCMLLAILVYSFFPLAASIGVGASTPILFILIVSIIGLVQSTAVTSFFLSRARLPFGGLARDLAALPSNVLWYAIISGTTANLGNILFVVALGIMSKAGATIIIEAWPVFAMLLAPLVIEKAWAKNDPLDVVLALVALSGIAFITLPETGLTAPQLFADPGILFREADIVSLFGVITAVMGSICFALCGTYRTQFMNRLPQDFREKYGKADSGMLESVIGEFVTKIFYFPIIIVAILAMEMNGVVSSSSAFVSAFMVGAILILVNILYSYALLRAVSSTINICWYFAPLMAVTWLIMAGMAELTTEVLIGGALILGGNLLLALRRKNAPAQEQA